MKYPAIFDSDIGGFVVTFRDIPEAITQGDDEAEAVDMAKDALLLSMNFHFEQKRQVPPRRGERLIPLPASVAVKVLLLNQMLGQNVIPSDLTRRMDTTRQEVTVSSTSSTQRASTASRMR